MSTNLVCFAISTHTYVQLVLGILTKGRENEGLKDTLFSIIPNT